MRQTVDTVWQRRGTSWLWDEEARNQVCVASEVWSLRQFLQAQGRWPDDLPSNDNQTLVVAGLDGCLDLLAPEQGEIWLGETIKSAILSFQDYYGGEAALIFWLPQGHSRLKQLVTNDAVYGYARRLIVRIRLILVACYGGRLMSIHRKFCCVKAPK